MAELQGADVARGVPLGTDSATIVHRLDSLLRRRKINPNPSCRYSKYRNILLARAQSTPLNVATLEQLYATGELYQFEWIVSCFIDDAERWPMIRKALFHDPSVPEDVSVHSPGRDAQFELYVAARLKMAGLAPSFAEPDIRASLDGWPFCVAAKRVKSRKSFLQAIKGACDQIARATTDGVIALDYSYVAARENLPYLSGDLDAGHDWARGFSAKEFHSRWPSVLHTVLQAPEPFALLIFTRCFHLHPDLRTHVISELHFARSLCSAGDARTEKLGAIQECLRSSVLPFDASHGSDP